MTEERTKHEILKGSIMTIKIKLFFVILGLHWFWFLLQTVHPIQRNLHPWFAAVTTLMFVVAGRELFINFTASKFWGWGFVWSAMYLIDLLCLQYQISSGHFLFGKVPTSFFQFWVPRFPMNLAYNLAVTILSVTAAYLEHRDYRNELYCVDDGCVGH